MMVSRRKMKNSARNVLFHAIPFRPLLVGGEGGIAVSG
jgi:hypothetical protein